MKAQLILDFENEQELEDYLLKGRGDIITGQSAKPSDDADDDEPPAKPKPAKVKKTKPAPVVVEDEDDEDEDDEAEEDNDDNEATNENIKKLLTRLSQDGKKEQVKAVLKKVAKVEKFSEVGIADYQKLYDQLLKIK